MTKQIFVEPNELVFIQSRATTNYDLVDEYAEMMRAGAQFEAAQGTQDDSGQIYVWDGLHRGEAARRVGALLLVGVEPGTKQDAEWQALTANQKHGLRRNREDIQRIIRQALLHPYGANSSDRELARHCGVDHKTVGKIRQELELSGEIPQIEKRTVTRNGQTYEQDTRHIGDQPYVPVWKLETAIHKWLSSLFAERGSQIQALEAIKRKTFLGLEYMKQLLVDDVLPAPKRKSDVIQACHNVLAQMWQAEKKVYENIPCPDCGGRVFYASVLARLACEKCWRQWDDTSNFHQEAKDGSEATDSDKFHQQQAAWIAEQVELEQVECKEKGSFERQEQQHATTPGQFDCPRCGQERIVHLNGEARCLNCQTRWPTPAAFLAEIGGGPDESTWLREELQSRFAAILARLDSRRLAQASAWLDDLESRLASIETQPTQMPTAV